MTQQKIDLVNYVPLELRNEKLKSILSNLFNRFLAEEQSVTINGQIGRSTDSSIATIVAPDLDREQNSLIPAIYYKTGVEESVFTFQDLVNKMTSLGIDTSNLNVILSEQSLNYAPPVNFDKLINYTNYYWYGQTLPNDPDDPSLPWNPEIIPEYYVQRVPDPESTTKLPIKHVATRNLKQYGKDRPTETITVSFITPTTFDVYGNQGTIWFRTVTLINGTVKPLVNTAAGGETVVYVYAPDITHGSSGGYGMGDPSTSHDLLFSFVITVGDVPFEAGDIFEIDITYITGSNTISFTPTTTTEDKGFISNIIPDSNLMYIDGVQLNLGDSILLTAQANPSQNGVYTVSAGQWSRAQYFDEERYLPLNSVFYITHGDTHSGDTWTLTNRPIDADFVLDDLTNGQMTFGLTSTSAAPLVSDWQTYNYWAHKDDIDSSIFDDCIQATRPIIEYSADLILNKYVDSDGYPSTSGTSVTQSKTRLNQIPQFDLFYYDGTHAKKTSGIFFYAEDPDYDIDTVLQRRLKVTVNSDYIFGLGLKDEDDRLLFWKEGSSLKTIWAPGPVEPVYTIPENDEEVEGVLEASAGVINIVGYPADGIRTLALSAQPPSYAITGTSARLHFNRKLNAAPGSYTITGSAASLVSTGITAFTLAANAGSYTITGSNTRLAGQFKLAAAPDSYTITGSDALIGRMLDADEGTLTITGFDANLTTP